MPQPFVPSPFDLEQFRFTAEALTADDVQDVSERLAAGGRTVVLDLGAVTLPTAGGLGRLVALHQRLRADGGRLVLRNVGAAAHEVFALTGLTDVLDVRRPGVSVPPAPPVAPGGRSDEAPSDVVAS
jgi:anti-anti-sigma factor